MSLTLQTLFTNKNPTSTNLPLSPTHFSKLPKHHLNSKTHFQNYRFFTSQPHYFPVLAKTNASFQEPYETSHNQVNGASNEFNLDALLSIIEFFSLASSAAVSVYVAFYGVQKGGGVLGSKILVLQSVVLVSAIVVGAVIRRRQWRRICGGGLKGGASSSSSSSSGSGANLLMRVEKMEEDLRSSATIIRVLSRQLEKLGIRFRVTRKALKEPLAETAALAQKNSEATRALAAQEDILEKELGEIQKVMLAMQEQQQKQLELILAIGKAGKLWETNRVQKKDQNASETIKSSGDGVANLELNQFETLALQKEANNERP